MKASVKIDYRLYEILKAIKEKIRENDTNITITDLVETAIIFALKNSGKFGIFLLFRYDLCPSDLGNFPEIVISSIRQIEEINEILKKINKKK